MKRIIKVYQHIILLLIGALITYIYIQKGLFSITGFDTLENSLLLLEFVFLMNALLVFEFLYKYVKLLRKKIRVVKNRSYYKVLLALSLVFIIHIIYLVWIHNGSSFIIERSLILSILILKFSLDTFVYAGRDMIAYGNFTYVIGDIESICMIGNTILAMKTEDNAYYIRSLNKNITSCLLDSIVASENFQGSLVDESDIRESVKV
ncbi:hypothetical protein EZV73_01605 [Acidaminobacter sp. JC074]|uniref:hypothetical protein n=1 Tax=Acidaminobacter sp. JC074 TaxID=2530199 RepID=UPI001F0F445A|nr:hypothetical protein [Acidaminobacter sp. JC074]MCH4886240.1 hypothetical protein [Acidaminobacter sp. JC074]